MTLVLAEVTGNVWKVEVDIGATVAEGDVLIIVESMKMEIPIQAPCGGVVREILVVEGDPVAEGAAVMKIE